MVAIICIIFSLFITFPLAISTKDGHDTYFLRIIFLVDTKVEEFQGKLFLVKDTQYRYCYLHHW